MLQHGHHGRGRISILDHSILKTTAAIDFSGQKHRFRHLSRPISDIKKLSKLTHAPAWPWSCMGVVETQIQTILRLNRRQQSIFWVKNFRHLSWPISAVTNYPNFPKVRNGRSHMNSRDVDSPNGSTQAFYIMLQSINLPKTVERHRMEAHGIALICCSIGSD